MQTRRATAGQAAMEEIRKMMYAAGALKEGDLITDCDILIRVENIDSDNPPRRSRWHPMGPMDDVREHGLVAKHLDDIKNEDSRRRR